LNAPKKPVRRIPNQRDTGDQHQREKNDNRNQLVKHVFAGVCARRVPEGGGRRRRRAQKAEGAEGIRMEPTAFPLLEQEGSGVWTF